MSDSPNRLSHLDEAGRAHIVDVTEKAVTARAAMASSCVRMKGETLSAIVEGDMPKGDVLAVSRIAGIQAAKKCAELIPLCHPLALDAVSVEFARKTNAIRVTATTSCTGRTGVEMEALSGASIAALAVYDMTKALSHSITIEDLRLVEKTGGKSDYHKT